MRLSEVEIADIQSPGETPSVSRSGKTYKVHKLKKFSDVGWSGYRGEVSASALSRDVAHASIRHTAGSEHNIPTQ